MKRTYTTPVMAVEFFETNEYIAGCTLATDGAVEGTYRCTKITHALYPNDTVTIKNTGVPGMFDVSYNDGNHIVPVPGVAGKDEFSTYDAVCWTAITIKPVSQDDHYAAVPANRS